MIGDPLGSRTLQFFYRDTGAGTKLCFPPVRVTTELEVDCVAALLREKAEQFHRKHHAR